MKSTLVKSLGYSMVSIFLLTACGANHMNASPAPSPQQGNVMNSGNSDSLIAMTWKLNSVTDTSGISTTRFKAGDPVNRYSLSFDNGRLSLSGGCNNMGGKLTLGPNNSATIGPLFGTRRACRGTLMDSDAELSNYLQRVNQYAVNQQALTLKTADGQTLSFTGTPTDATHYGTNGIRKFIEVKHDANGTVWREVKYDSNWIRIPNNAPWQTRYPTIQGFTPEMNRQYIVRLNEYTDQKTGKKVWVKDMITSSGILN